MCKYIAFGSKYTTFCCLVLKFFPCHTSGPLWTNNDDAATTFFMYTRLMRSKYRTTNPEEANLFFVPLLLSLYCRAKYSNLQVRSIVASSADSSANTPRISVDLLSEKEKGGYYHRRGRLPSNRKQLVQLPVLLLHGCDAHRVCVIII